jgi:hypothetical protein
MDKVTDSLDWKKDESTPEPYTGPVQEPLTQPDLVSESQVDQYKQQKQAQINTVTPTQPTPTSVSAKTLSGYQFQPIRNPTSHTPSTISSLDITAIMGVLIGFLVVGVIGATVIPAVLQSIPASDTALASAQNTVLNTVSMTANLFKLITIVSVAAIILLIIQKCGLIPRNP